MSSNQTTVHRLKVWPEFWAALVSGEKTFGRTVSYVLSGPGFGLLPDYVCMGLANG